MLVRASSGSGGGGGSVKTDVLADTSTASQDITINTGLSTVKRFTLIGNIKDSSTTPREIQVLTYNADRDGTYYTAFRLGSTTGYGGQKTIGTAAAQFAFILKSVSGGTVVVTTPSNAGSAVCENLVWYAE